MQKYNELLKTVPLFKDIEEENLQPLLSCLSAKTVHYDRNQIFTIEEESKNRFGIVLSGEVQVFQEDYYGNRSILAKIEKGDVFGESLACADSKAFPVSVVSTADSIILFIDCSKLSAPCAKVCSFHSRMIQNMLNIVSMKNIALMQKIEFVSKRSTREKLIAYLSSEAQRSKSSVFIIPFDRQELADYLYVDRSAMSTELGKMRDDGLLRFYKNQFELL